MPTVAAFRNPVVPSLFFCLFVFWFGFVWVFCLFALLFFFNKLPNCVSEEYFMGMLAVIFRFCFLSKHSMCVHMCEVNYSLFFTFFFFCGLSRLCAPQKSNCHQILLWTKEWAYGWGWWLQCSHEMDRFMSRNFQHFYTAKPSPCVEGAVDASWYGIGFIIQLRKSGVIYTQWTCRSWVYFFK